MTAGVALALATLTLVYSQTRAFSWDEGYHLLAAQLVKSGKRLYLDFCFPQSPLNTWWNALWMRLLGDTWHVVHAVAAVLSCGAAWLAAGFVRSFFPRARLAVLLTIGLNVLIFQWASVGQAYAIGLILLVSAFRLTVASVDRESPGLSALAGLAAGAAAMSTLLTAPAGLVLLIWAFVYNRAGSRLTKAVALIAGECAAFLPLLWVLLQDPRRVFFNIIQYQLQYRQVEWEGAIGHDVTIWIAWLDSSHGLILALLAITGLLFVLFRSDWPRERRAGFYLCAWLAAVLMVHISQAHPTFRQYYLFAVPFLAILAAAGLFALSPAHPNRALAVLALLLTAGLAKSISEESGYTWAKMEPVARKVVQVTPPGAPLLADENVYFLTRHIPPSGMELLDSHKFRFPPAQSAWLHLVPEAEVLRRITAGDFATVESCAEYQSFDDAAAPRYRQKAAYGDCTVYWDKK